MPNPNPNLRLHKASGNAVVTLRDSNTAKRRDYYCGRFGSPESHELYATLVREWNASGKRLPREPVTPDGNLNITINKLILEYTRWPEGYHTAGEFQAIKAAARVVRYHYGKTLASQFTPMRLEDVREAMIAKGRSRKSINHQISRVRAFFKWGVSRGMVDTSILDALGSLQPRRRGKTSAREPKPIRPVPEHVIAATLGHLSKPVAALVRVQLLTGTRSGEIVLMRPCDIDTSGKVWIYRPVSHKTAHHGHERAICIGP